MSHPITVMSEEAFRWYLTGLADGEGCFHFRATIPRTRGTIRPQFQGMFGIAMRDDELPGLTAIQERLGIGALRPDHCPSRKGTGNPLVRWEVCRSADLVGVLVPHFDRFPLRMKKARDYAIWRRCVLLWHESTTRIRVGRTPMQSEFGARGSRLADHEIRLLLAWIEELKAGRKYVAARA